MTHLIFFTDVVLFIDNRLFTETVLRTEFNSLLIIIDPRIHFIINFGALWTEFKVRTSPLSQRAALQRIPTGKDYNVRQAVG